MEIRFKLPVLDIMFLCFKIDVIVWKYEIREHEKADELPGFKIDVIVWKYVISSRPLSCMGFALK